MTSIGIRVTPDSKTPCCFIKKNLFGLKTNELNKTNTSKLSDKKSDIFEISERHTKQTCERAKKKRYQRITKTTVQQSHFNRSKQNKFALCFKHSPITRSVTFFSLSLFYTCIYKLEIFLILIHRT